ncbi:HD-GYP domain-containing protein, partial [Thermotoga sp.]|uniref:HD-GYP domain-containing protein n=1 Tax=Thermotoga sp. TaxID=28240 RepID=UPI0025CE212E
HIYNVAFWSEEIGRKAGLDEESLSKLYLAGLLHDIGKVYIDERILNKEGRLTPEEYQKMKKHVDYGYNMVRDLTLWDVKYDIAYWVIQHHEKYDGSGYPFGLREEEITLEGRILKIADTLDAMLSPRSYRDPMPLENVMREIKRLRGKDFDPMLADLTVELLREKRESSGLLEGRLLPATMVTEGEEHEGILRKTGESYIFISDTLEPREEGTLFVRRYNLLHKFNVKMFPIDHDKVKLEIVEDSPFSCHRWLRPIRGILKWKGNRENVILSGLSDREVAFILSGVRDMKVDEGEAYRLETSAGSFEGYIVDKVRVAGIPHFILQG